MRVLKGVGGYKDASPVVTLGNFDGVHIGHADVLVRLVERARTLGCPSVLYTFNPHPLKVVAPEKSPHLIVDTVDKRTLIEAASIDYLVFARFTAQFASKHPKEFVQSVLVKGLGVLEVWVGRNYSFGKGRAGNVESLKEYGKEYGFKVVVVTEKRRNQKVVSSSRIRALVIEGDVQSAASLLGRSYSIKGKVVRGAGVGKSVGFATANIDVSSELLPGNGVYAAVVTLGKESINALVNIGTAPTFKDRKKTLEAHLLDFNRGIYGRRIRVSFLRRLRDEVRFGSKEELGAQIAKDFKAAQKIFTSSRVRKSKEEER